jgi:acetolactate synthase I/II/III large subunit
MTLQSNSKITLASANTAEALLSLLGARGFDRLFANGGTDFASIIEGYAHLMPEGCKLPRPLAVPHEMVAASMAHGCYLATGRPQLVMVHVTVGTANLTTAIINAARARVPIVFMAGRTPITEKGSPASRNLHIHWGQEAFDQGAMVRQWTKWDYELRSLGQLETVVDRAISMAMAEPRGPVYLTLPREVLAEPCEAFVFSASPRVNPPGLAHPEPEGIQQAASLLAAAHNPLIITSAAGMWPAAVPELVRLAETAAIPVVESAGRYFMNFPTTNPFHAGFDPHPLLSKADTVLVVEADTPWFPSVAEPARGAPVIHLGTDPLHHNYPIWGFPADLVITAHPAAGLAALNRAIGQYIGEGSAMVTERRQRWSEAHQQQRALWRSQCEKSRDEQPIDPGWLSYCINQVKDHRTVCVNEYDLSPLVTDFGELGSYFGSPPAGGLGWGLGAALGVKLAAPERDVICTVGDGAYMFGVPTAAHYTACALKLPILFVIFNNRAWGAVRHAALQVHPGGWASRQQISPLWDLQPTPHFEKLASAFDAYGERVEDPRQIVPALIRALDVVRREGRQAILNVICKYPA